MLYLPIAMDGMSSTYDECYAWMLRVFKAFGIQDIVMWHSLFSKSKSDLQAFDAVYIGGGNTYKLLAEFRETGFDDVLVGYAADGGTIYGGSAGAIVLGKDISTCAIMDSNEVGLIDTHGLGLTGSYSIWCHYVPWEHDGLIAQLHDPIIAMPERSGLLFDGSTLSVVGTDSITIFDDKSQEVLLPGHTVLISV